MADTLGRYTLQRKIATGGMADIWLASLNGPGGFASQVVIKTILPHLAARPEFVKMFLSEARLAAQLHHPNIAQIFELGEEGGIHYLAMEYVPGVDLRRLYREADEQRHPIPVELAVRVVIGVAQALGYAHAARGESGEPLRVVHRDISPENILVTYEGGVKLVDFGIAKVMDEISDTRTGVLKGKYSYMAPERVENLATDGRADLFSLGVVAFEILTGLRLFRRDSDLATIHAVAECDVPLPSSLSPEVPQSLDAILLRALAKEPDDRYPDGAAFALALEQFLHDGHYAAASTHLAAYLRELYPHPGLPPSIDEAQTESTTGERPRTEPSEPSPAKPAPPRSTPPTKPALEPRSFPPLPELPRAQRISQLAPRGPIRDPKLAKLEEDEGPPRPSKPPHLPEKTPVDHAAAWAWRAVSLRRWALRGLRLALLVGLIALGLAALPSLKRALSQLPTSLADVEDGTSGPRGRLSLDSTPAATVFLGKRRLGPTPLVEVELPAGPQKLHLVNDIEALDETLAVVVTPDQTLSLQPRFPEGTVELPTPAGRRFRVYYKDALLGTIPGPAIQLCAGTRDLTLIDERTGARETRRVTVAPRIAKP